MFDGQLFEGIRTGKRACDKTVIFLSRFVKEKGVYELLEAFKKVTQVLPDAKLIFAGDGPERPHMEVLVATYGLTESVSFVGYLRGTQKAQVLVDADVFVFPTYHGEGCPVALLEAMAAGLPIISTGIGGISDIFVDDQNGILLAEVSPDEIAAAIIRMLEDDELRRSAGQLNKEIAWQRYEAAIVTRRMEQLYEGVVSDAS